MGKPKAAKTIQAICRAIMAGFLMLMVFKEAGPYTALVAGLLFIYTEIATYYILMINRRLNTTIDIILIRDPSAKIRL